MQLEMMNPKDLTPYYQNAKPHKVKLNVLKASIQRFGFDQPIVVDENRVILKGHGRQLASIALNLKEVPVVVKTGLTEAQKKILRIADNKIFERGSIDDTKVKEDLEGLIGDGVDGLNQFFNLSDYDLGDLTDTQQKEKKQQKGGTGVAGKLLQCPKCGAVHWESP